MGVGVLAKIAESATEEEYKAVLKIATADIKFNNIGFNRMTKAEELKALLDRSLNLVRNVQA